MKSTLIATIPAFAVILVLVFGFVTFHMMIQKAEATGGAACNYLGANCSQESNHADTACRSDNADRCNNAAADTLQVCSEYSIPATNLSEPLFSTSTYRGSCSLMEQLPTIYRNQKSENKTNIYTRYSCDNGHTRCGTMGRTPTATNRTH